MKGGEKMELTISRGIIHELNLQELMLVNGGGWGAVITTVGFIAAAAGAVMVVGMLPAVAVVAVTTKTVLVSQALIWGGAATMGAGGLVK